MAKDEKPKKKTGRPRIQIDWDLAGKLCGIQATQEEIAYVLNCSVDTLERACKRENKESFAEYYKRHSSGGKISLRRLQWQTAKKGNPGMQIWLGKQWLGQTDKIHDEPDEPKGSYKPRTLNLNVRINEDDNGSSDSD